MLRTLLVGTLLFAASRAIAAPPITPKLHKGVNLSHWWVKSSGDDKPEKLITEDDVKLIKAAGLTHVRIPIDPCYFVAAQGKLNDDAVAHLLKSTKLFTDSGIAVVIDAQPMTPPSNTMLPAENPKAWADELEKFWKTFAPALKQTNSDLVAVELLNEPNGLTDPKEWPAAQEHIRTTVRAILPRHTIILTGDDWGGIDGLIKLSPDASADTNVVYSIHFYEPHTFTHQGATWGSPMWKEIKDLHYPFDAANTNAAIAAATDPKAAASIKSYARDKWNAAKIKSRFDKAKSWADEHHATLYLGEFGAYRGVGGCDETSRKAWLTDVAAAAEADQIPWCMWDYLGGFALTDKAGKAPRTINEPTARALGLTIPPAPPISKAPPTPHRKP